MQLTSNITNLPSETYLSGANNIFLNKKKVNLLNLTPLLLLSLCSPAPSGVPTTVLQTQTEQEINNVFSSISATETLQKKIRREYYSFIDTKGINTDNFMYDYSDL